MKKRGELTNGLPEDPLPGGDSEPRPAGLDRATELKLLDAALLSDMQAFSELFEHYRPALYGLCCRRLNDFALAEDVVQEAFLKAFKSLPNSDHRKPIWPWLAAIAHRMCIDLQRRRSLIHYSGDIRLTMDEDAETNGHTESALDSVIASEDRAELWKSLDILPERQRRVFVLYEVDGLSCADIAFAEGVSVAAIYRLLFRARKKMRAAHPGGRPLPAIILPVTWLRWKLQQLEERVRPLLGVYGEGLSNACMQAACLGAVVTMVVAAGNSPQPLNDAGRSDELAVLAAKSQPLLTASLPTALPRVGAATKVPAEPQQSVAGPTGSLMDDVINPYEDATPETTALHSLMSSPNYENDHTILASGYCWACVPKGSLLFISPDGGANWRPQPSRLLSPGPTIVTSPGYPHDQRIFASGDQGLQQSDDGGGLFKTVSPFWGPFAISPSFGWGDSRILIAGKTLLEYDADLGATQLGSHALPPSWGGGYHSIVFASGHQSDPTFFVSDSSPGRDLIHPRYDQITLYRCKRSVCDQTQFPMFGPLILRLSPRFEQDGLAYAFTYSKLLVSNDGTRTFKEIQIPLLDQGSIKDVAILWNTSSDPVVFVSVYEFGPGVYRSLDAGRSWNRASINLPDFRYGAEKLIVTPTGRLLATGTNGLACSENGGQTWAPRCTPEP